MTSQNLQSGNTLKAAIDGITSLQAKNALAGARVHLNITDANNTQIIVSNTVLAGALGDTAYNTICSTALASLNTALASAKSGKQTALDAL